MSTTTVDPTAVPSGLDVCDQCGAHGKARYVMANGFDLVLCQHHSNTYAVDLAVAGACYDGLFALDHA